MVYKKLANLCKLNATSRTKFKTVPTITKKLSVPCPITFLFLVNRSHNSIFKLSFWLSSVSQMERELQEKINHKQASKIQMN